MADIESEFAPQVEAIKADLDRIDQSHRDRIAALEQENESLRSDIDEAERRGASAIIDSIKRALGLF
jgi:hypothetical protein